MESINKILFDNDYAEYNNLYFKSKNNYISQIKLIEKDDKYIQVILTHSYKNQEKEKKNQMLKKTKILNFLKNLIKNEPKYEYNSSDLYFNEISCENCENIIVNKIENTEFNPNISIVNKIYTENGISLHTIDENSANYVLQKFLSVKNCENCTLCRNYDGNWEVFNNNQWKRF